MAELSNDQLKENIEALEQALRDRDELEQHLKENEETLERFITDQYDSQERYQSQAAELVILAEELAIEQQRAEASSEAKSRFLSSVSHELRTPLNAVLGYAQLLQMEHGKPLDEPQRGCVRNILHGGNILLSLIMDILDMSQIEAGNISLKIEDIQLRDTLQRTLLTANVLAEKRGIILEDEGSSKHLPDVRTDASRLTQVLLNLLSNAIKYNRESGTVILDCEVIANEFLRISITDTGCGIPADKFDAVFEPFDRIGQEGKIIEGTGIGLTITKQLVEVMGGRIGFESEVDKGSVFWVDLPVSEKLLISERALHEISRSSPRS